MTHFIFFTLHTLFMIHASLFANLNHVITGTSSLAPNQLTIQTKYQDRPLYARPAKPETRTQIPPSYERPADFKKLQVNKTRWQDWTMEEMGLFIPIRKQKLTLFGWLELGKKYGPQEIQTPLVILLFGKCGFIQGLLAWFLLYQRGKKNLMVKYDGRVKNDWIVSII